MFGALVRVRVEDCGPDRAMRATTAALSLLARIHGLMSFHDPSSELSALNRTASRRPRRVSRHTFAVLQAAQAMAAASSGVFDPTVAPLAVQAGNLPRPEGAPDPDPDADWRDLALDAQARTVRFRRPLWLDLGGVAKGYAVDVATEVLRRCGVPQGCVEAGGDLRVFGPRPEVVALAAGLRSAGQAHGVRLLNRSLASSGGVGRRPPEGALALHFDAARRRRSPQRFVTVLAERCVHADALTKVVMARGRAADPVLATFGARAGLCSVTLRWSIIGAAP